MALLLDLMAQARRDLDDFGGDVSDPDCWMQDDEEARWSNEELTVFFNLAQREAARRIPIVDSTTAQYCQLTTVVDQIVYPLDPAVITIRRVWRTSDLKPLNQLDEFEGVYDESCLGDYLWYQHDQDENTLRLWSTPDVVDTINFTVGRLPAADMVWDGPDTVSSPETHRFVEHYDLIHWVRHLAYLKNDENARDIQLSSQAKKKFADRVGPERSARMQSERFRMSDGPYRTKGYYY